MTPTEIVLAVFGVLGAFAVGSFLCVVIERMPVLLDEPDRFGDLYGMRPWGEVLGGSSRCSGCGADIRPFDKIPTISWLVLRGKCRTCGDRIPGFHPLVELAVPAISVGLVLALGWGWRSVPALWLVPVGVAVAAIDFRVFMVPTRIVWPAFFVSLALSGVAVAVENQPRWMLGGIVGLLAFAGPLFLIWFVLPGGMGFGDVRLATLLGWTVGFTAIDGSWMTALFVAITAVLGAAFVGIILSIIGVTARGRHAKVPFAPSMILSCLLCIAFAEELVAGFEIV